MATHSHKASGQQRDLFMKRFEKKIKGQQLSEAVDLSISSSPSLSSDTGPGQRDVEQVTVHWGDILPWLVDAIESKRSWVRDFDADQVVISRDLHNVICAYRHYRGNLDRPNTEVPVEKAA